MKNSFFLILFFCILIIMDMRSQPTKNRTIYTKPKFSSLYASLWWLIGSCHFLHDVTSCAISVHYTVYIWKTCFIWYCTFGFDCHRMFELKLVRSTLSTSKLVLLKDVFASLLILFGMCICGSVFLLYVILESCVE